MESRGLTLLVYYCIDRHAIVLVAAERSILGAGLEYGEAFKTFAAASVGPFRNLSRFPLETCEF
jgi:hypothetical protein